MREWLIVNGAFDPNGGQEFANWQLAKRIAETGRALTLVAHRVDAWFEQHPNVRIVRVPTPFRSEFLGERLLERAGTRHASSMPAGAVVLGNGGNFPRSVFTWIHFVHRAWRVDLAQAPLPQRILHEVKKLDALRREERALTNATVVIANSALTAQHLRELYDIDDEKVVCVWFGSDSRELEKFSGEERHGEYRLLFVGALGWDFRKGLDVALRALARVSTATDVRLVVAGGGSQVPWRRLAQTLGIADRVRFLGPVSDVGSLMAEVDVLVSPARYESYGLAIHEALALGLPVLVSEGATGVQGRLGVKESQLFIQGHDPEAWAAGITRALSKLPEMRACAREAGALLNSRSWKSFADEFIDKVEQRAAAFSSRTNGRQQRDRIGFGGTARSAWPSSSGFTRR